LWLYTVHHVATLIEYYGIRVNATILTAGIEQKVQLDIVLLDLPPVKELSAFIVQASNDNSQKNRSQWKTPMKKLCSFGKYFCI